MNSIEHSKRNRRDRSGKTAFQPPSSAPSPSPSPGFSPSSDPDDEDAPIPGTVFTRRQARYLRQAVIIMGVMLVAGFVILIAIIARRAAQAPGPAAARQQSAPSQPASSLPGMDKPAKEHDFTALIPPGFRLRASHVAGSHLVLVLENRSGQLHLIRIDLKNWRQDGKALIKSSARRP